MNNKQTQKEITITVITLTVVAALLSALVWYARTHRKPAYADSQGNLVIDTNATDEERKQENPLSNRLVYFAGIDDTSFDRTGSIELLNLPENEDFLMRYIVTDLATNEQIFETDLIPSGQRVYWTPGETLPAGEYDIAFTEMPYALSADGKDYVPLTQGRNVIKLIITE